MASEAPRPPSFFQRFLLPGLAFKAVVIGGGYADRARARRILHSERPVGRHRLDAARHGCCSAWSASPPSCSRGRRRRATIRASSRQLLGPGWIAFEAVYLLFIVLILAVYGAAAGAIGAAVFGLPALAGTIALAAGILLFVTFGNSSVERLFEYVSYLLYGVYALFIVLAFTSFGDRIAAGFALDAPSAGWAIGGITYFGYNIIGAVVILPVVRHLTSSRDAVIAGALCGPFTMLPALLFFIAMVAYLSRDRRGAAAVGLPAAADEPAAVPPRRSS